MIIRIIMNCRKKNIYLFITSFLLLLITSSLYSQGFDPTGKNKESATKHVKVFQYWRADRFIDNDNRVVDIENTEGKIIGNINILDAKRYYAEFNLLRKSTSTDAELAFFTQNQFEDSEIADALVNEIDNVVYVLLSLKMLDIMNGDVAAFNFVVGHELVHLQYDHVKFRKDRKNSFPSSWLLWIISRISCTWSRSVR